MSDAFPRRHPGPGSGPVLGDVPLTYFKTGKRKMSVKWQVKLSPVRWPAASGRVRDRETALLVEDLLHSPAAHCPDRVSALAMAQFGARRTSGGGSGAAGHANAVMRDDSSNLREQAAFRHIADHVNEDILDPARDLLPGLR